MFSAFVMPKLENNRQLMNFVQEPKVYVDALLEVHKKNADTVNRSFKGEAGFVASLDRVRAPHLHNQTAMNSITHVIQACKEFVNKNGATGISTSKSPELLAKHADALLRKNNKLAEESDLEEALNQVVSIRRSLDVFAALTKPAFR